MNKTIPSCMVSTSDNNFEILEELFEFMYSDFLHLYWLIKDHLDDIEKLNYKSKENKESLKIEIEFSNSADVKKILDEFKKTARDDANIKSINKKKDCIVIEISSKNNNEETNVEKP